MTERHGIADANLARGARPVWLFTLNLPDGRRLRVASRAVSVSTRWNTGDGPYRFDPLLRGVTEFDEEQDLYGLDGVGSFTQANVELSTTLDLAKLQGDWYAITAGTAELALIWEGQAWEDRVILLRNGTVQNVEFGLVGQATRFSLEATPPSTSIDIGDDSRDIGADFPAPMDKSGTALTSLDGSRYVTVIGTPLSVPGFKIDAIGANNRLLLCGHHLVDLGLVTVFEDGVSVGAFTPVNGTTTSGDICYVLSGTQFDASDGAYTWSAARGGIAAADDETAPALGAGGVLRFLLERSGLPLDRRRLRRAYQLLAGWRFGIYVDAQTPAIDVVRDRLAKYLPLVELESGDGLWFAYADPHAAPIDHDLVVGQQLVGRIGGMRTTDLETTRNAFTMLYDREAFSKELRRSVTLDRTNSTLCLFSDQQHGTKSDDVLECTGMWDPETALLAVGTRAARLAMPRRILTYEAAPDAHVIEAGDAVRLTDPDWGVRRHRGYARRVNRAMRPFHVELELVDRTPFSVEES